jgi:hypothetical protein
MGGGPIERAPYLTRLMQTAEDLGRRLDGSRMDHVSDLCKSLIQIAENLLQSQGPDGKDLEVLPHLADAIRAAFPDGGDSAGVARDIASSVSRFATH